MVSVGTIFGKRTWLAATLALAALAVWVVLGALLITKEIVPLAAVDGWIYAGCGVSALVAGLLAGAGKGGRLAALAATLLLYGVLWAAALGCGQPLDFRVRGIGITLAVIAGGFLSYLLRSGGRRKRRKGKRTTVKRRVGSAT